MAERKRETILSHITKKNREYITEHLRKYHCLTLQQSSIAVSPIRLIIAYVWLARTGPLKTVHRHSQPRRRKAVLPVGGVHPATVRRAMSTIQKYAAAYESGCGRHIPDMFNPLDPRYRQRIITRQGTKLNINPEQLFA